MPRITVHHHSTIPAYEGPHAIPGVHFRPARRVLGVTSWGMNILSLDPLSEGHPEHDHGHDGQEEVYVVLVGSGVLRADTAEHPLAAGDLVRVPPEVTRKIIAGDEGMVLLALGATPGAVFEPAPSM